MQATSVVADVTVVATGDDELVGSVVVEPSPPPPDALAGLEVVAISEVNVALTRPRGRAYALRLLRTPLVRCAHPSSPHHPPPPEQVTSVTEEVDEGGGGFPTPSFAGVSLPSSFGEFLDSITFTLPSAACAQREPNPNSADAARSLLTRSWRVLS
jgi:hypothetical protein